MPTKNKYYAKIKRLKKKADTLYQQVCLKLSPNSMASGQKAEVTHHFCPKSLSNALRYDIQNGITLTNGEHFRHHTHFDPAIYEAFTRNKSAEWFTHIRETRKSGEITFTAKYLENKIKELEEYGN